MTKEEMLLRRRRVHLTLTEIAKRTGIHVTTLSAYERGETKRMSYEYMTRVITTIESVEFQQQSTTTAA